MEVIALPLLLVAFSALPLSFSLCKSPTGGFHYLSLSVAFFAFPLVFFLSADIFIFFLLGCFFEKGESRMLP